MSNTLYFLNGDNLNKEPFNVFADKTRSAPGQSNVTLPIARGNGSRVSENKIDSKIISVSGKLETDGNHDNFREVLNELDKILLRRNRQTLRLVTDFTEVITTSDATDWTASGDANSLTLSTEKYNNGSSSIKFDITQSTNVATLTYSSSTQTSLANYTNENVELSLYCPDVEYLQSIDIRIGNDSSNYYSREFTADYRGEQFKNGWILLSVPFDSLIETGTVTDSTIDYFVINLNFNNSAEDIDGCYLDLITSVNETTTRNFGVYRDGEARRQGENYMVDFDYYTVDFLCEEGVAKSTHRVNLFSETGINTTSTIIPFNLEGSVAESPEFTLTVNTSTDVNEIQIKNIASSSSGAIIDANNVADGDTYTFNNQQGALKNGSVTTLVQGGKVLPLWEIGKNRVELIVEADNPTLTPTTALTRASDRTHGTFADAFDGKFRIGQSFTTTTGENITEIAYTGYRVNEISGGRPLGWWLYADNSGNPDVAGGALDSGVVEGTLSVSEITISGLNISVSTGTKYWFVIEAMENSLAGGGIGILRGSTFYWSHSSSSSDYTGGEAKTTSDNGATWSSALTGDQLLQITQTPTPSWDLDFRATYRPIYGA